MSQAKISAISIAVCSSMPAAPAAWNSELRIVPEAVRTSFSRGFSMTSDEKPSGARTTLSVSLGLNRRSSASSSSPRTLNFSASPTCRRSSCLRRSGSARSDARSPSESCSLRKIWSSVSLWPTITSIVEKPKEAWPSPTRRAPRGPRCGAAWRARAGGAGTLRAPCGAGEAQPRDRRTPGWECPPAERRCERVEARGVAARLRRGDGGRSAT